MGTVGELRDLIGLVHDVGAGRRWWGGAGRPLRPVTPTSLDVPIDRLGPGMPSGRAKLIRRAVLVLAAFCFVIGIAAAGLAAARSSLWLSFAFVVMAFPLGLLSLGRAANIDVRRDGLSRHHRVAEMGLLGAPLDLVANWQALVEHLRFTVDWLDYDPASGDLALVTRRVRLLFGWPQYVVVLGRLVTGAPSTFTVLVDSTIAERRDFDANRATLEQIVRHFAATPRAPA